LAKEHVVVSSSDPSAVLTPYGLYPLGPDGLYEAAPLDV
jgi:hypothetical protein